jgi:hypothetical protein
MRNNNNAHFITLFALKKHPCLLQLATGLGAHFRHLFFQAFFLSVGGTTASPSSGSSFCVTSTLDM